MSLDYLLGYPVTEVDTTPEEGTWAIVFSDGSKVISFDDSEAPSGIDNMIFKSVTQADENYTLKFGAEQSGDNDVEIEVSDHDVNLVGRSYMPGQVDPSETLPPDPSPERVAHGPNDES